MSGSSSSWCREIDEKINYTKLCRLLVDGGTQAVRSVFDGIHPPSSLKAILNANKTTLQTLKKPRGKVLNDDQWDKLYPPSGSSPKSEDFDITLLFVLLRNICGLTAPVYEITFSGKRKRDWDKLPHKTENSQEANLVRIKYYRNNTIAHKPNTEINDADFEQHWQDISSALLSLGLSQDDIDELKSDPLGKKDYSKLLYDWYVSDEDIKTQLDDVKTKIVEIKSDTADLRSDTADLKSDTADLKSDTADLKSDTADLKSDTADLKSDTADLKSDTADLKSHTGLIPGIQENISQLKNICSSRTYLENLHIGQLANSEFSSLIESLCTSFHPNTRQWVLSEVKSYIYEDKSSGMLITAGPGMGKSTIAAKICQTYKDLGCLAGCHFFQFSNSTRNNPRLMLQSIARQMCDTVPGYREALESKLESNFRREKLDLSCEELFTVLFEEACSKMKMDDVARERFVVVVDAMDECCRNLKWEFLHALDRKLPLLPSWLRFIITTRPSTSYSHLKLKKFDIEPKDSQNKSDLTIFFTDRLSELFKGDDLLKLVSSLVQTTKGLFLVAFFVVDHLQKQKITSESEVLSLFPKGISSVYEEYFSRLKEDLLPYISHKNKFFEMLEAIVAALKQRHPIEKNLLYRILGLKTQRQVREIPGQSIKSYKTALDLLHSLFPIENDNVTVFHKSVVDWLIQEDIDHDFSVRGEDVSEVLADQSHDYIHSFYESLPKDALDVCPRSENENVASRSSSPGDLQSNNEELRKPLKKAECPTAPHEFIVSVEEGNEILANQCYDVLSDIRNGKKDLDKPLELTDSEKYALEFGIEYIIHSCTFSNEKKMEVLMNCFVICSALLYRHFDNEMYSVPFKGNSIHFDVSKELENVMIYGGFKGNLVYYNDNFSDGYSHVKTCRFNIPLNFIDCVGFFLQAVKTIGLNVDELSPNPKNLIDKHRLPLLSCNLIAVIPEERFSPLTSVIGLILDNLSMTEVVVLPCKDGMMVVKYKEGLTLIHRYIEDGTPSIKREETFSGLKKMCITPDQRFIVATEVDKKGKIEIIDAISLKPVKKYKSPNVVKSCHVFGDQPWYIVARCYNNKIYVMEGETGEIRTTFDVEKDEEVEAVSSSGHIALNKTWVSIRVRYDALFTDDDGNFLEEMSFGISGCPDRHSPTTYRKLFLLDALQPCTRVYFYPRRETPCSCRHVYQFNRDNNYDFYQKIVFSHDGKLLAYRYQESVFIVRSEDGSLFERVFVYHLGQRMFDIIHLSHSDIILRQEKKIFIIDVTKNQTKHVLYLPGKPREVYVVPRQQEEPLAILVKNDNKDVRDERSKNYSIFRYVFHNIDL